MYNAYFGFREKPFRLLPNPEYLFLSKSHEEALAHLNYAIAQGDGFVEITGSQTVPAAAGSLGALHCGKR